METVTSLCRITAGRTSARRSRHWQASAAAAALAGALCLTGITPIGAADERKRAETHLYWGDVHLHSNFSLDAYSTANTSVTPDLAYRFARGLPIRQPGLDRKIQIRRPLDFLAVTDHAEFLGLQVMLDNRDPLLTSTPWGQKILAAHLDPGSGGVMRATGGALSPDTPERREMLSQIFSDKVRSASWGAEVDAANRNYVPGSFTTLFGWEWTAMPGGKNLHRIVLADADGEQAKTFIPYDNSASMRPEDLFKWLGETKARTGIDFLAIPHNSNISGGLMFQMTDSDGNPISAEYARTRAIWEPLVEVTQMKGTSEIHPDLAPNDEFADFEIRRKLLVGTPTPPNEADYARSALLRGLLIQGKVGANPYKFGMIGSTDSHTGMSSVQENDFTAKLVTDVKLTDHYKPARPVIFPAWEMSASGRVAVWATENTRKGIFSAFKRKEAYATSGTRISLRFFGGFDYAATDAQARDIAAVGYAKGIPMGGDLTNAPAGKAPTFLIWAVKDPLSGKLDRVQVVKGWLGADGKTHEKIYNVAWSDNRKPGADGKLPAVGNTVDIRTGLYTNTIGAVQLATVWKDPDFKPGESAFYYLRVLEIPTPRQSLFDAIALGIDFAQTKQPATLQERAYSSPIWYTPSRS
jgi:hypothetical protein